MRSIAWGRPFRGCAAVLIKRKTMTDFYVYILKCSDGSYYTGHTDDIEKRISEHKFKRFPCYTCKRLPIEVVFVQMFPTRDEAFTAERQIKKWIRKKKEALINEDWELLQELSRGVKSETAQPLKGRPQADPSRRVRTSSTSSG